MMKCLLKAYIKSYCFAVHKDTGYYELVCVYTDKEYAKKDLKRWQQLYNDTAPDGEDPMVCVLLNNIPTPDDIRYLIGNDFYNTYVI